MSALRGCRARPSGSTAEAAGTVDVARGRPGDRSNESGLALRVAFIPSRREAWLSAIAVFALAAAVRIVAAASLSFPVPEDTAYYAGVARNLVEGRGLVTDALWSYQTQPLQVPRQAFEVWLPLPSLLAAIPMWLAGAASWFRAAQAFSVLVSSIGAALAWRLGADVATEMKLPVGRARTLAVGSGVVASFLGPLVVYGALPDSTALFAALSLAACLLMTRITATAEPAKTAEPETPGQAPVRERPARGGRLADGQAGDGRTLARRKLGRPGSGDRLAPVRRVLDRRLLVLGLLLGLAALTRSEAIWLGLTWVVAAWFWTAIASGERPPRRERLRLILVPAVVAGLVFLPWAIRDWLAFGSPLPGQTVANALSVKTTDIYAYHDQPTLARYLAQGPAALFGMRVTGTLHNLVDVLVIPGFPVGLVGLLWLPVSGRLRALRPLALLAAITFLAASLVFPVSTLWGTFLHAAGATFVLLVVSCLLAFDALIAWVGRIRHWWRPVAWLGPALAVTVSMPLLAVSVIALDRAADKESARYEALPAALEHAGISLRDSAPVITDHPIWLAETEHVSALALPEESPEAVVELARRFHATLLMVGVNDPDRDWPAILDGSPTGRQCFREVILADNSQMTAAETSSLAQIRVYRLVCP